MKYKKIVLFLTLFMTSCSCSTGGNSQSVSTNPKELVYDASLPKVERDNFEFEPKTYEDFPTDLEETTGLTYELSEDQSFYKVSGATSFYGAKLVIPAYHNNLPVKEIASEGFAYKNWLSEVYIPETIEKFGAGAFNSAPRLTKIYFNAKSLEDFEGRNWVFLPVENATNEIDLYIGPSVERIPNRFFFPLSTSPDRVVNLKNIYFSKNSKLKSIGDYAFYKSKNVVINDLPDTVESIGNYAFYEANSENLNLSASLKSIGQYAFAFNENLKHVKFYDSLESIDSQAFYNCHQLVEADLSNTKITTIGTSAFRNCVSMKNIMLPDTLKTIEKRTFENCGIEVLDLPLNLQVIEEDAFKQCGVLRAIKLNANLITIKNGAFEGAVNVTKLVVSSIELNNFEAGNMIFASLGSNTDGVEVIFLNTVKNIPERMFFPNANEDLDPKIQRVVLLKSLQKIGNYAFFELKVDKVDYEGSNEQLRSIDMGNNVLNIECYNK